MSDDNTPLEDVTADIDRIIRNSGHDLLNGNALQVARVIAARLTDQHKLRPREKVYTLVRVSMHSNEERWAFSSVLAVHLDLEQAKSRLPNVDWKQNDDYWFFDSHNGFPLEQYRIYEREVE